MLWFSLHPASYLVIFSDLFFSLLSSKPKEEYPPLKPEKKRNFNIICPKYLAHHFVFSVSPLTFFKKVFLWPQTRYFNVIVTVLLIGFSEWSKLNKTVLHEVPF